MSFVDDYVPPEAPVFVDGVQENVEQVDEDYQYQEVYLQNIKRLSKRFFEKKYQYTCSLSKMGGGGVLNTM